LGASILADCDALKQEVSVLHDPSVTALMALVTAAAEPGSVVTRALVQTARSAGIGEMFGRPSTAADRLDQA